MKQLNPIKRAVGSRSAVLRKWCLMKARLTVILMVWTRDGARFSSNYEYPGRYTAGILQRWTRWWSARASACHWSTWRFGLQLLSTLSQVCARLCDGCLEMNQLDITIAQPDRPFSEEERTVRLLFSLYCVQLPIVYSLGMKHSAFMAHLAMIILRLLIEFHLDRLKIRMISSCFCQMKFWP